MKESRKSGLLILLKLWLFCLITGQLSAQVYPFETIGLEQGMPGQRINDFLQDSRGFYWLATDGTGLLRYDGYEFKTYNDPVLAKKQFVSSLAEDEDGKLWAGMEHSLMYFDGLKFKLFDLPIASERIIDIVNWEGNGMLILSNSGKIWRFHDDWELIYDHDSIKALQINIFNDMPWFVAGKGLYYLTEKMPVQFIEGEVRSLHSTHDHLWVSTSEDLKAFDSSLNEETFDVQALGKLCAAKKVIIGFDKEKRLVIIEEGDIKKLGSENGLPLQEFKGCYRDNDGVIWLYSNKGLVKLQGTSWRLYKNFPVGSLPVSAVLQDEELMYAGLKNGISVFSPKNLSGEFTSLPYGLTLALEKHQGDVWAGTERGLVRISNTEITRLYSETGFVFALYKFQNDLYIGSERGLMQYKNGSFQTVNIQGPNGIPSVYAFDEAADGSLWAGTYLQGFLRKYKGEWQVISEINGRRVDSLRFSCFAAVAHNEIWAGSLSDGIFHFSPKGVQHISSASLNFAEIHSMVLHEDGTLWAGTNKGLLEIRKGDIQNIISLTSESGFLGGASSPQALSIKEGKLLAGTVNGLQFLDLESYYSDRPPPALALTGIKLFLEESEVLNINAGDSLAFSQLPADVQLTHDLNFLSFDFAGLTSYQKDKLHYRYRLLGQSNEWTHAGSRREAIFSNIKPGKYTFQAEVARYGEDWSSDRINYEFEILRPLWMRWWFISLIILVLGGLTYGYVRDRVNRTNQRLKLENALLEMERKALRLQMNPHFIFNALDSISSFIFKKDPEKAVRYLNNFAKLMRLTLESSMEHLHPVETEVSVLKNYLELEKLRFQGKFTYEIEVDEEIDYDVGIPPMLIQPHVENAILHGLKPKKVDGKLDIRFVLEDDLLLVEIEDNGIGRKAAKEMNKRKDHRSMATQINRDRLRLLKSSKGEKVNIRIIDKELNGVAAGTKVIIRLPAEEI